MLRTKTLRMASSISTPPLLCALRMGATILLGTSSVWPYHAVTTHTDTCCRRYTGRIVCDLWVNFSERSLITPPRCDSMIATACTSATAAFACERSCQPMLGVWAGSVTNRVPVPQLDRLQEALQDLCRAIDLDAANVWRFGRGAVHICLRRFLKACGRCVQGSFYFNRGLVLFDMEEYEAAIKDFTSTIEAKRSLFRAHFNRGNCYRKLGRLGMWMRPRAGASCGFAP